MNSSLPLIYALLSALAGGQIFAWLGAPLPWLLGSIGGTAVAAMAGAPTRIPKSLRDVVLILIGLMIGSRLDHSILHDIVRWPLSLAGIVVYVFVVVAAQFTLFRRVGGYDRATAYFSASPGGFMVMTVVGGEYGGSERIIALTHSVRYVIVVFALVFGVRFLTGDSEAGNHVQAVVALRDVPVFNWLLIAVIGVLGYLCTRLMRIPGSAILWPMILMGAVRVADIAEVTMPTHPIIIAEVVLGSSIGAQFAGTKLNELWRTVLLAGLSTLVVMAISLLFAIGMYELTHFGFLTLLLAFSPGGLSGLSLVALALAIEPAFVMVHNMLRVLLILLAGPLLFSLYRQDKLPRHSS